MTEEISLCLIARNESPHIGGCINSAREWVDEIIVVDTGSCDLTPDIAASLGATVIEEEWQEDFSYHRNTSLEAARGDWILFLDCDERLAPGAGEKMRVQVGESGELEAFFVRVENKLQGKASTIFPAIRLFRNRDCYRFRGKIHEQVVPAIMNRGGQEKIGQADFKIIHYGYHEGRVNIRGKIERNLRLLQDYSPEKKNGFYYYNLGTEYLRLGDNKQALECYLKALKKTEPERIYGPILVQKMVSCLMEMERFREAREQLEYYQKIYPGYGDLYFLQGVCRMETGFYSRAAGCFEQARQMNNAEDDNNFYPAGKTHRGMSAGECQQQVSALSCATEGMELRVLILGRNDSSFLPDCLQSINEIASEVIYADFASDDNSRALAYQYGARVVSAGRWGERALAEILGQAGSEGGEQLSSAHLLYLYADEVFTRETREQLVTFLQTGEDYATASIEVETPFNGDRYLETSCRLFREPAKSIRKHDAGEIGGNYFPPPVEDAIKLDVRVKHNHYRGDKEHIIGKLNWLLAMQNRHGEGTGAGTGQKSGLRGRLLFLGGRYERARQYLAGLLDSTAARRRYPGEFMFYLQCLLREGDPGGILAYEDEIKNNFSEYTDLHYLLGLACHQRGDSHRAEEYFRHCINQKAPCGKYITDPGTAGYKPLKSLAALAAGKGNYQESLSLYREMLSCERGFRPGLAGITHFFAGRGRTEELSLFLQKNDLRGPRALGIVARNLIGEGEMESGLRFLREARELCEEETDIKQLLAEIEVISGRETSEGVC